MIDSTDNRYKVKRGEQLPQSKLTEADVRFIRQAVEHRDKLKKELKQYTNKSLAEKFGVHLRTVEKAISGVTWLYVQ